MKKINLKKNLIIAFIALLPLLIIVVGVYLYIKEIYAILTLLAPENVSLWYVIIAIFCFALFSLLVGFLADKYLEKKIKNFQNKVYNKVPMLKIISETMEATTSMLELQGEEIFKSVVLVQVADDNIWSFGFLTSDNCTYLDKKNLVSVIVRSSLHEDTCRLIFVPKNKIRKIDMPIEQAQKILISLGVLTN